MRLMSWDDMFLGERYMPNKNKPRSAANFRHSFGNIIDVEQSLAMNDVSMAGDTSKDGLLTVNCEL